MSRRTSAIKIWDAVTLAASSSTTSAAVDIQCAEAFALHVTAITGTSPAVALTYSVAPALNGPYTIPQTPSGLGVSLSAADVLAMEPEAAGAIKIIATNNGTGPVILTGYTVVIEAA